jgi:hypothetical protein
MWVRVVSEVREKIKDTDSVSLTGRGWLLLLLGLGPWAGSSRAWPKLGCWLSLFRFLISFLDFAYKIQIKPNQFLNFCKIHRKVLN